jgi:hypothetical protein|tara:strand:- start:6288 stop:7172 length:885 start_codon:yes stop_codon:yes gene_type:complete
MKNYKTLLMIGVISSMLIMSCSNGGSSVNASTDNTSETGGNDGSAVNVKSKILMELFTSTTCGPCLPQNTTLNNYLNPESSVYAGDLADDWIILRYHVWWPSSGDPYYEWNTAPVINREGYYGVGYVPHMYTQGWTDSGSTAATWRTHARAAVDGLTPFNVQITGTRDGYNLSGNVTVTSAGDVNNLGFKLFVAVTHDNSQYQAPNGQTVFDQTFIDFLTLDSSSEVVSYGEPLNLGVGETYTKSYNWTLGSNWPNNSGVSWSTEDLTLIAFVQFDNSGSNEKKIFQVEALNFD